MSLPKRLYYTGRGQGHQPRMAEPQAATFEMWDETVSFGAREWAAAIAAMASEAT